MGQFGWALVSFIFLATYSTAFLNGDDVVHMIGRHFKDLYFPAIESDWIPTRPIDPYLRGIFAHTMDLLFFPLQDAFGLDFFRFYKIFNATFFSGFIGLSYFCLRSFISYYGDLEDKAAKSFSQVLVLSLLIAGLMNLFPWKNQVHLIAYYFPGLLCFIFLSQISLWGGRLYAGKPKDELTTILLTTLAYICIFSHEAYALVVGLSIVIYSISSYFLYGQINFFTQLKASKNFRFYVSSMLLFIAFSAISTVIFWKFSTRIAISAKGEFNILSIYILVSKSKYELAIYLISSLGYLLQFLAQFNLRFRFLSRSISYVFKVKTEFSILSLMGFSAIFSSVFIAIAISVLTGVNYLSHHSYPWGGIMIVADLFSLIWIIYAVKKIYNCSGYFRGLVLLLLFILFSKLIYQELNFVNEESKKSRAVQAAYQVYLTSNLTLIDTGLSLNKVPSQIKPLPDETIPSDFILAYREYFSKYYGVNRKAIFR